MRLFGQQRRKNLVPSMFWLVLRSIYKQFPGSEESVIRNLIPRGNRGAGILYGRQNIAKTLTYRATHVPGGFNVERDARRAKQARFTGIGSKEWLSQFGSGHEQIT